MLLLRVWNGFCRLRPVSKLYFFTVIIFLFSCKKDKITSGNYYGPCSDLSYEKRTSSDFDFVYDSLESFSVFGQSSVRMGQVVFTTPSFNPKNDYQICYIKDLASWSNANELWIYNLCDDRKNKITSNVFYSLDWSVKDWLIYTGSDYHIYKIKSSGDSLTQLTTTGGIHSAGKWSPDGKKFWFEDGGTNYYVCNETGMILSNFTTNFDILDWYNNDTLLVNWGGKFCYYDFNAQNLSSPIHTSTVGIQMLGIYNSEKKNCIWENYPSQRSAPNYLLNWDFSNNTVDTIKQIYFSYKHLSGDYNSRSNKLVLELYRAKWYEKEWDKIQYRSDIVVMNTDGTNERMLNLE